MGRSQVGRTGRLLPALLLLTLPGCLSIWGPKSVSGRARDAVTIQCHYDAGWEGYVKWWCRGEHWGSCNILLHTTWSEQTVRKGRLSIQDDRSQRVVTVTVEELCVEDDDFYWCGIQKQGTDLGDLVRVYVYPVTTYQPETAWSTTSLVTAEATTTVMTDTPGFVRAADADEEDPPDAATSAIPEPPITWGSNSSSSSNSSTTLPLPAFLTRALTCHLDLLLLALVKLPLLAVLLCTLTYLNRSRGESKRK